MREKDVMWFFSNRRRATAVTSWYRQLPQQSRITNKMTKMIINMRACVTRLQVGHVLASHMPGILCFQKPIACVIIERFNRIKSHFPGFNLCHCQSNSLRPLRHSLVSFTTSYYYMLHLISCMSRVILTTSATFWQRLLLFQLLACIPL